MSERTQLTNLFLLCVLAGVLLVSGSLQCAFDCMTQAADQRSFPFLSLAERVDTCHPSIETVAPSDDCLNKACHKRIPYQRDLGGPAIYTLGKMAHPLYSSTRQPTPQYRAGSAIRTPQVKLHAKLTADNAAENILPQTIYSIRTTVLLC